jgi:UDPglucose 6-dehydrogenase
MGPEAAMKTTVLGLGHLGCVTAACLAGAGIDVCGLDADEDVVRGLRAGRPPVDEPGLAGRIAAGLRDGRLSFTSDAASALRAADVLWVAFDTPVSERDEPDVPWVRSRLEAVADSIRPGTLVLVSSQVPVGFTASLERDWARRGLRYACSPENLRVGRAIESFERAERIVAGVRDDADREPLARLLGPFTGRIEWMSVESAEMTKHALNAFLATSVSFVNEIARVCEAVGADAREVERGLRSDARIGPRAYLSPGAGFAGGTLAREVRSLASVARGRQIATPLLEGVLASNEAHEAWLRDRVSDALEGAPHPVAAVLGLTYKPGAGTLRRSSALELCRWLRGRGVAVRAHDPSVAESPSELRTLQVVLCASPGEAIRGADVAVVATAWPDYRGLRAEDFLRGMRRPRVIDPSGLLVDTLAPEPRIVYVASGRAISGSGAKS